MLISNFPETFLGSNFSIIFLELIREVFSLHNSNRFGFVFSFNQLKNCMFRYFLIIIEKGLLLTNLSFQIIDIFNWDTYEMLVDCNLMILRNNPLFYYLSYSGSFASFICKKGFTL